MIVFCMLVIQSPVLAMTDFGNIGPTTPSLSLAKQRKVTIQIDRGSSGYSDSYVQDRIYAVLKPILDAQKIELDARVRSITTTDTIVNSTAFSDDSENFYVSLNNSGYPEFTDPAKSANILNLFAEKQVAFIGMGNASNKAQIDSFISKNQGNGSYIDNANLDAALSRLGDYVLGRTSIALDLFVGEGANQDKIALQGKIDSIVKPKLAAANIDGDINIKMLRKEEQNPYDGNLYYINKSDLYNTTPSIMEYSLTEARWNTLFSSSVISNGTNSLTLDYTNNLYFISEDKNVYRYDLKLKKLSICSNTSGAMCLTTAINGKMYWSKTVSYSVTPRRDYSEVYEYDPLLDTNTFVTSTVVAPNNSSREITSMGVSLDLKLIYYYSYGYKIPTYWSRLYNSSDMGFGVVLGEYDLVTKQKLIAETEYSYNYAYIKATDVIILSDNRLYIAFDVYQSYYAYNMQCSAGSVYSFIITNNGIDISSGKYIFDAPYQLMGSGDYIAGAGYATSSYYHYNDDNFYEKNIITNAEYQYSREYHDIICMSTKGLYYSLQTNTIYGPSGPISTFYYPYYGSLHTENAAKYPIIEKTLVSISSFDSELQNKTIDESKDSYIAYLGDANLPELNDYTKKTSIANKLKSGDSRFIGLGTATNQAQFQDLIAWNNSRGTFYDNSNLDVALNNLADNIIANTHKPDRSLQGYVAISEGSETIATEEGTLDVSGLPLYSATYMRSKDYVDVTGGSSYNFTTSESVNNFYICWYTSTLQFISKSNYTEPPTNLIVPSNATYAKVVFNSYNSNVQVTLINNTESSGYNLTYSSNASDVENDDLAYLYKYTHDPSKIAGVTIDNPSDKIAFNDTEISVPIKKFTKPGTYTISMRAKDIPKKIVDTENILSNGDAEIADASGNIDGWSTWVANPSITNIFARLVNNSYTISGNASFMINTSQVSDGSDNSACFYKDVDVSPNTSYTLNGLLNAHRCSASLFFYELDNSYNILKTAASNTLVDNETPQTSSISFTAGANTTKLRVLILKGKTTNFTGAGDYVFADNITLIKNISDSRFSEYRKTSSSVSATIYSHRLPKANFSFQVSTNTGAFSIQNLADNELSYDPDHSSRADKGIIDRQWKWAEVAPNGETTWHDGLVPNSQVFAAGSQILLWYRVRDTDGPGGKGAWSKPKLQRVDGQLINPVALFVAIPNSVPMQSTIAFSDQSYSRNLNGVLTSRVWTIRKVGATSASTLTFSYADVANNKYYKGFTSLGFGSFIVSLTVTDSYGKVSNPYSQTVNVFDNINPTISVNPSSGTFTGDGGAVVTVTCNDSTLGNTYNRGLKTIEYVWSKNATAPQATDATQIINIPTEGVYAKSFTTSQTQEGTWYLYVKDKDFAGNSNSNDVYVKLGPYIIITNRPPTVSITNINPSYVYEGDTVKIKYKPGDPDGDTITSTMQLTKNGTVIWSKTKTITPLSGIYDTDEEKVLDSALVGVNYKFTVTVTDQSGESATDEITLDVHELSIKGKVDHADLWKSNWVKYNQYLASRGKQTLQNAFFTGEKYVLSALTTEVAPESNVTALYVSVKLIERSYSPVWLNKQSTNSFNGEMWNKDMRGTRWRGKHATFLFTVTYSNGAVKTDSIDTYVVDDDYYRVKMAF